MSISFQDDKCRHDPSESGATDVGFTDVEEGNEQQLKDAVATIGPISVAIDAGHTSFQFYKAGMYVSEWCVFSLSKLLWQKIPLCCSFQVSLRSLIVFKHSVLTVH